MSENDKAIATVFRDNTPGVGESAEEYRHRILAYARALAAAPPAQEAKEPVPAYVVRAATKLQDRLLALTRSMPRDWHGHGDVSDAMNIIGELLGVAPAQEPGARGREAVEWRWVDERGRAMTNWKAGDPPPMTAVSDERGTMCVETRLATPSESASVDARCWQAVRGWLSDATRARIEANARALPGDGKEGTS